MANSDLVFNVRAQTSSAVAGFKQLAASIKPVEKDAAAASKSLAAINKQKVAPKVDDHEITALTKEVARLQDEMRDAVKLDVNADTRKIQTKIRGLQSTIKSLQRSSPTITPTVNTGFLTKLKAVGAGASSFFANLSNVVGGLGPIVSAVGQAAVGAAKGIFGLVQTSLNLADAADRSRNTLKLFLGSFQAADKELRSLTKFAAETPFELPEIKASAQRLLGVGISAKKTNQALKVLGDTASAFGTDLEGVTTVWSQMVAAGKVNSEDMNQLVDRGIPAWKELGKAMGKTVPELKKMASEGKLGTDALDALYKQMGKDYAGQMNIQSGTFSGMVSTLKDTVNGVLTDIGNALLPFMKIIVPQLTTATAGLGATLVGSLPPWIDALAKAATGLIDMAGQLLIGMKTVSVGILSALASLQTGLGQVLVGISSMFSVLIAALGPLGAVIAKEMGINTTSLRKAGEDMQNSGRVIAQSAKDVGAKFDEWIANYQAGAAKAKTAIEKARLTAQLTIKTGKAQADVDRLKAKLEDLRKKPRTATVKANIRDAKAKLAEAERRLKQLQNMKAEPKVKVSSNANTVAAATERELANIPDETVHVTIAYQTRGKPKGSTADTGPGANMVTPPPVAPPQVSLYLRDEKLADLIDIRVNNRAARASRIVHRRDVLTW